MNHELPPFAEILASIFLDDSIRHLSSSIVEDFTLSHSSVDRPTDYGLVSNPDSSDVRREHLGLSHVVAQVSPEQEVELVFGDVQLKRSGAFLPSQSV